MTNNKAETIQHGTGYSRMSVVVLLSLFIFQLVWVACTDKAALEREAEANRTIDSLQLLCHAQAGELNQLDNIMTLMTNALDSINGARARLLGFTDSETGHRLTRQQMLSRLEEFSDLLSRQRQRIDSLESTLSEQSGQTLENMREMINFLQHQLNEKDAEIAHMLSELNASRSTIRRLQSRVSTLTDENDSLTTANDRLQTAVVVTNDVCNEGYVLIASKQRLKDLGILVSGGLFRKSKIDLSAITPEYCITVDIRAFDGMNINSRKAKILTPMPEGSYIFTTRGYDSFLQVLSPSDFWSVTNYLIIQTD